MRIEEYPREKLKLHGVGEEVGFKFLNDPTKVLEVSAGYIGLEIPSPEEVRDDFRFISEVLHDGELFGYEPFNGYHDGIHVVSLTEDTELTVYDVDKKDPEVFQSLWQRSFDRIEKAEKRKSILHYGDSSTKLAYTLLDTADKDDAVPLTEDVLGAYAGVTRELANRTLNRFTEREYITKTQKYRGIRINRRPELESIAAKY
jgi:CRP-like cAMP-binding protein